MSQLERRFRRLQWAEALWTVLMIVGFVLMIRVSFALLLFAAYMLLFLVGGGWFYWRQYHTLDELGRLRWLKSQMMLGMVLSFGLGGLLLWEIWQGSGSGQVTFSLEWLLALMSFAVLASWGTWHYLGWRNLRGQGSE